MKRIILLAFGIFSLVAMNGQKSQTIDSAYFQVFYRLDYVTDLLRPEKVEKDEMILLVGNSITSYYSYRNFIADSSLKANPIKYFSLVSKGGKMALEIDLSNLSFGLNNVLYFFDKRTNEFSCRSRTGSKIYGYREQYRKPEWKISSDTVSVLGHLCQKATSEYGGRSWTVWFATGIPVPEGPWKLKGLPGLIMKAEDDSKSFIFECTGFSRLKQKRPIVRDDKDRKMISKKDFVDMYVKTFNDFFNIVTASLGISTEGMIPRDASGNIQPLPSRELNPFEKDGI